MPAELFRTVAVRRRSAGRRLGAVPLSVAFHAALLIAVVVIPLVAGNDPLPPPNVPLVLLPPPIPVTVVQSPPRANTAHPRLLQPDVPEVPLVQPQGIQPEDPFARTPPDIVDVPSGLVIVDPNVGEKLTERELTPPPPPTPKKPTGPVRLPDARPVKIHNVPPVYPQVAIITRTEGTVVIEATISATGRVEDAHVVRSVPLLDQAALDAVRQWVFTPTLLNGEPVPIILTVNVEFKLR